MNTNLLLQIKWDIHVYHYYKIKRNDKSCNKSVRILQTGIFVRNTMEKDRYKYFLKSYQFGYCLPIWLSLIFFYLRNNFRSMSNRLKKNHARFCIRDLQNENLSKSYLNYDELTYVDSLWNNNTDYLNDNCNGFSIT